MKSTKKFFPLSKIKEIKIKMNKRTYKIKLKDNWNILIVNIWINLKVRAANILIKINHVTLNRCTQVSLIETIKIKLKECHSLNNNIIIILWIIIFKIKYLSRIKTLPTHLVNKIYWCLASNCIKDLTQISYSI